MIPCIMVSDPPPHLLAVTANTYVAPLSSMIVLIGTLDMTPVVILQ